VNAHADTELLTLLDQIVDPLIGRGLAEAGAVAAARREDGRAIVHLRLGFPAAGLRDALIGRVRALLTDHGIESQVSLDWAVSSHAAQQKLAPLPGIRNVIAVASGKGGVGKSTVAANFALALAAEGARVGMLDADIYGPSQPQMLGVPNEKPQSPDGKIAIPVRAHGLQVMSIGFLVDAEQPMIWRGPIVTQALMQLINDARWDDLDYLVVDMPPGTGDVKLTLSQRIPLAGAVIVTTPQDIATLDAKRGLQMFRRVEVPVLGIVENMALYTCPNCGHSEHVFGQGGGDSIAERYDVELLGSLPLSRSIREQADAGAPTVVAEPDSEIALLYRDIARRAAARLAYGEAPDAFPSIEIAED